MQITIAFGYVNWLAVMAATIASFVIGGFWYSPFFVGKQWMAANKMTRTHQEERSPQWVFVGAFVLQWLAASLLAAILGPNADLLYGLNIGLLIGVFFVTTAMGITNLFERRPVSLILIHSGYHIVSFAVMGMILGAWHA